MHLSKSLLILAALSSLAAFAQDKMGYVNMADLFEGYYKTVNANIIFENRKKEFEDRMNLLRVEVENAGKDARSMEVEARNELLSKEAREEAMRKFRVRADVFSQKREEFERARQKGMADLRRVQFSTEEGLIKDLAELVKKFAKDNGYTHVFDVSGQSMNRMPTLLVYPEQQDITKDLLQVVNNGHETELKEATEKLEAIRKSGREEANKNIKPNSDENK